MELFTTDSLPPNIYLGPIIGTPRYLSVVLISIICSTKIFVDTNYDEYVTISTVGCFLDYHNMGVWLVKYKIPATVCPIRTSWYTFTST